MVTYTRQVTNTSASDENNRVLLKVVRDTRNVSGSFETVGKTYSRDLTECGVRLLRAGGAYLGADTALLRRTLVDRRVLKRVKPFCRTGDLDL